MIEEELNLYQNFDFDVTSNDVSSYHISRTEIPIPESSQRKRNRKRKARRLETSSFGAKKHRKQYDELDEYEMFFFPNATDREIIQSIPVGVSSPNLNENRAQQTEEARQSRKNSDKRYKGKEDARKKEAEQVLCRGHLTDNCHKDDCQMIHQMRLPRRMRVCKFFVGGMCNKDGNCVYLHNEFPCMFYYLGYPHPKHGASDESCRFSHGKPLSDEMKDNFLRYMENSLKSKLSEQKQKNSEEILQNEMREIVQRLNQQQLKLLSEVQEMQLTKPKVSGNSSSDSLLENILSEQQITQLKNDGLTSLLEIKKLPTSLWEKYSINVDQMLKIQCKAVNDGIFDNEPIKRVDGLFEIEAIREEVRRNAVNQKTLNIEEATLSPERFEEIQDPAEFLAGDLDLSDSDSDAEDIDLVIDEINALPDLT